MAKYRFCDDLLIVIFIKDQWKIKNEFISMEKKSSLWERIKRLIKHTFVCIHSKQTPCRQDSRGYHELKKFHDFLQRLDKRRENSFASLKNKRSKINQNKQLPWEVLMIIKIYNFLACLVRIAFILCIQD